LILVIRMSMASTRRWRRAMLAGVVCPLALLGPSYAAPSHPLLDRLPGLVLWAWERPEDLRGLNRDVAVAFLAQTIDLKVDGVQVSPRRQPLRVDPETPLIAVTRVGTTPSSRPSGSLVDRVARTVADTAGLPGVKAVQIDFDTVRSERPFYRQLLRRVKEMLGARTPLSMTALASWCTDDSWIGDTAVDEVVPMFFQMGPFEARYRSAAAAGRVAVSCRTAMGTSLDEPMVLAGKGRRIYVFSARGWTGDTVAEARRRTAR
jgi:hypothetical protein